MDAISSYYRHLWLEIRVCGCTCCFSRVSLALWVSCRTDDWYHGCCDLPLEDSVLSPVIRTLSGGAAVFGNLRPALLKQRWIEAAGTVAQHKRVVSGSDRRDAVISRVPGPDLL